MSKEADWVAAMLTGQLLLMALLSPAQAEGRLPVLEDMERPSAVIHHVPLVGPIIGQVQRQMMMATWQLEAIPIE